jgi:6-phospho-beta-glucosidase
VRLAIIGGGGFRVPLIHRELVRRPELGVHELVLQDVSADRLKVISAVLDTRSGPSVRLTGDLAAAVTGADFVFSAVRVGGAAGRVADERRALRRGLIGQETVGAGGLSYGLRTLPVALDLAGAVARHAPAAWLINFTNPAGLITEASRTILGDRVIGICDSPAGLVERARRAVGRPDATADYAGINHLGWLRSLQADGTNLLPKLLADPEALRSFEEGRLFRPGLLRALGALPNEYLYFYYCSRAVLAALSSGPTRGEFLQAEQDAFFRQAGSGDAAALWEQTRLRREQSYLAEARTSERDEADLAGGGYERVALELMRALAGGGGTELILNVANRSTFDQLPADLVVETRCEVDASGARPLPATPFSLHQLGLISSVRAAERAIIEASDTGSREAAVAGFTLHPLIADEQVARQLVDDLLADVPDLLTRRQS